MADIVHVAPTVAAIKAKAVSDFAAGQVIELAGYHAAGDGGGGHLIWDAASTATADGGHIIALDSAPATGRLRRVWNGGPISVKHWGARGNVTGDDTAAIQAAIDYVNSRRGQTGDNFYGRSGVVFVPQGGYIINAPLVLKQRTSLIGEGASNTMLTPIGFTGSAMVIFDDTEGNLASCRLEDIQLAMQGIANLKGVYGRTLNESCAIRACTFSEIGAGAKGIHCQITTVDGTYCGNFELDDNYFLFHNTSDANTVGLHLEGISAMPLAPCMIFNNTVHAHKPNARSARGVGIRLDYASRVHIASSALEDLTVGVKIDNGWNVLIESTANVNNKFMEIYGDSFGVINSCDQSVDPSDTPLPTLLVDDTVTSDNIPAVDGGGYIHRHEFDTRTLSWNGANHTATSNGSATLVATTVRGKEYTVWVEVTTALDGTATFRLGDGTTDTRYLAATGASTTGYHHVPVKIMGDGLPIVLTWASTSAGALRSRYRVR